MFRDAASALVKADPMALGGPEDEYDAEAAQVVRLVLVEARQRDDVLRIASDVFAHYFGGDGHAERLEQFADTVWARYQQVRQDA
jgi:hypothetical protein